MEEEKRKDEKEVVGKCRPGPRAGQEGQLPRALTCLGPIYNNIILILY